MMSLFSVLLVAVLNLVPADVESFTFQMHEDDTVRFTRQTNDWWQAVELPNDDLGSFRVNGPTLIVKMGEKEYNQSLGKALGVDETTDWSTIDALTLAGRPLKIDRIKNGIDLVQPAYSDKSPVKTHKIRWQ